MLHNHGLDPKPRNGHTLIVGHACRISGCANQKELSLEDQQDNARDAVHDRYDGPFELNVLAATKAKGERLDRPELEKIENAYRSGEYDLFIFDDLSRLLRGGDAVRLLGIGVDNGTRTICLNDGIDTDDPTWEEDALNACSENVANNERTSKRIKQKSMNRFKKFGQPTGRPIAGYTVPAGVKSYDGWVKQESWTAAILEGKKLAEETLDVSIVADYFNRCQLPVGPYCRRATWSGNMVRRFLANPLLKGMPQRGAKHTVKHHGTGRRVSVDNPKGPNYYRAPHLAFLTEHEFDALNALLDVANQNHGRKPVNGVDPLFRRPRNQSCFPGLHARCWYCGCHYVWGGNGINENLMCSNSREWHCWHSVGFSGPDAAKKLVAEICGQLSQLGGFDHQFVAIVENAGAGLRSNLDGEWRKLRHDEDQVKREKENLLSAIKKVGQREFLLKEVDALEANERQLQMQRYHLQQRGSKQLVLPETLSSLREMLEDEFCRLAIDSPAFGKLMQKLVPDFYVYAVRLCDGGHLLPRAKVTLNLAGTFPDVNLVAGLGQFLTRELTLDLFCPPQRERIREEAVRLQAEGLKPKAISQEIKEKPTATAVQNALALQRMMLSLKLDSPYVILKTPPNDYPKLRRHRHPRYCFQPLNGYAPPAL